jgi:dolichyl-diphosphooligosaccharide--protein glycosyltransferase
MIHTFNAVTNIGNWDFDAKVREYKKPIKFLKEFSLEQATGTLNGSIALKSVITVDAGVVKDTQMFQNNPEGQYLEIIRRGQTILYMLLMDEKTYLSNFNQMFILGVFDKNLFKEIYNDFPYVRLYQAI